MIKAQSTKLAGLEPDKLSLGIYGDRIDSKKNVEILSNIPLNMQHALTYFDGKIFDYDARPGNKFNDKIMKATELIDVNALFKRNQFMKAGDKKSAENIEFATQLMKDIAAMAEKQEADINSVFQPFSRTLGSAAVGNLISTPYEVVRRINYLTKVTSPAYNMANFNAKNGFNVQGIADLNVKGFYRTALPTGVPEVGDNVTPELASLVYSAFEKSIYADSFRYEFSMREVQDSVFSLQSQIEADIPGVFAKMEDDKCTTLLNALASSGTISPKWDATSGSFFTGDAAKDVETAEVALDIYGSGDTIMLPRDTRRAYQRNINAALNSNSPSSEQKPDSVRTGAMERNANLTFYVNNVITAGSFIVIAKQAYADFYQGPKVNVSYKNTMTAAQVEGRILFSFNGVREKITAAAKRYVSALT